MGGRGAYAKSGGGGIAPEYRKFHAIGTIEGVKVIEYETDHPETPVYSNTPNTVYYRYNTKKQQIDSIYFYKEQKLYRSVDIMPGNKSHAHLWKHGPDGKIYRKVHDKSNHLQLLEKEVKMVNLAKKWRKNEE